MRHRSLEQDPKPPGMDDAPRPGGRCTAWRRGVGMRRRVISPILDVHGMLFPDLRFRKCRTQRDAFAWQDVPGVRLFLFRFRSLVSSLMQRLCRLCRGPPSPAALRSRGVGLRGMLFAPLDHNPLQLSVLRARGESRGASPARTSVLLRVRMRGLSFRSDNYASPSCGSVVQ